MLLAGIDAVDEASVGIEVDDGIREGDAACGVLEPRPAMLVVRHVRHVGCFDRAGQGLRREMIGEYAIDSPENVQHALRKMAAAFAQVKRDGLAHVFSQANEKSRGGTAY